MYHAIGTPAYGDSRGLFSLSPKSFKQQMALLANWRAGKIVAFDANQLGGSNCRVAITFDDGYLDNLEVAAPILSELNIPFTVFVTSEFVRKGKPGFLSTSALRNLAAIPGAQIGAHGANHVPLTQCSLIELHNELQSSKNFLEDVIGREVRKLAYPYGAANRQIRDVALEIGYRAGVCSFAGINRPGRDPMLLARTEITSYDCERTFMQKLRGNWDWYRWRTVDPATIKKFSY
jgi:peptidoglycan/xylan/chitin deacetylase (PgdA/CDA1 family)